MIELPTQKSVAEDYNPRLLVIFGKPKTGKSSFCAALDNNLIIDLEDGYRALSVFKTQATSYNDLYEIAVSLDKKKKELGGKNPYKFITIDNASRLEVLCLKRALHEYRMTTQGKNFGVIQNSAGQYVYDPNADIRQLPKGGGYGILREVVKRAIDMFTNYADTVILVGHVKDSTIEKNGKELNEMSFDLIGKLANIICGLADGTGYMYRNEEGTHLSFRGGNDIIMGVRCPHLREKDFLVAKTPKNVEDAPVFDISEIFLKK